MNNSHAQLVDMFWKGSKSAQSWQLYRMYASMEDQGPLKQLGSALTQLGMPTPEAPQQLGVHEAPVHLNWHVKLQKHSLGQGQRVRKNGCVVCRGYCLQQLSYAACLEALQNWLQLRFPASC